MTSSRETRRAREWSQPPRPPCHCVRVAFTCWCLYRSPALFFSCWRGLASLCMDADCKASRPWGRASSTATSLMSRLSNALGSVRKWGGTNHEHFSKPGILPTDWPGMKNEDAKYSKRRLSLMYGRASCWTLPYCLPSVKYLYCVYIRDQIWTVEIILWFGTIFIRLPPKRLGTMCQGIFR